MSSGSSDDLVLQFHALVTVDDQGKPYGEASTDQAATEPDGYISRDWKCLSTPGYGIAPITFEVRIPVNDVKVDEALTLSIIGQTPIQEEIPAGMVINSPVKEVDKSDRSSWDDEKNWEPEGDVMPPPRIVGVDDIDEDSEEAIIMSGELNYDDIDFGETAEESAVDESKFSRFLPPEQQPGSKKPKLISDVFESLRGANFEKAPEKESEELNLTIIGEKE